MFELNKGHDIEIEYKAGALWPLSMWCLFTAVMFGLKAGQIGDFKYDFIQMSKTIHTVNSTLTL